MGGYIRDDKFKSDWLREHTLMLEKNVGTIIKNAGKYPQQSYNTVAHAIQSQWIFLQHITWETGYALAGVEKMLRETFLPYPFFRNRKTLSPIIGVLSTMPVNKSGLALLNPVTSAKEKYIRSHQGSAELIQSMKRGRVFFNADQILELR